MDNVTELKVKFEMNEMQMLVKKLHSSNANQVLDALTDIKTNYIKKIEKRVELEKYSIVQKVISLLDHPKYCDISISIIADACVQKYWIPQIIKKNGIKCLSFVMNSLINCKIQNRACRALGNIAKHGCFEEIRNESLIKSVLMFLNDVDEINFKQNALRTLRIFGTHSKCRDIIIRENGTYYITKLLQHSNKDLVICCTQTLAILTENCGESCFKQFIEAIPLKHFINMYKDVQNEIKINVLKSLQNISYLECARPILIKADGVQLFLEAIINSVSLEIKKIALLGLCSLFNYRHMFFNYGTTRKEALKSMVEALRLMELEEIHFDIVSALFPLTFEQENTDILIELGLVTILTERLKIFLECYKIPHGNLQTYKSSAKTESSMILTSESHAEMSSLCAKKIDRLYYADSYNIKKESNQNTFDYKPYSMASCSTISHEKRSYFERKSSICSSPYSPSSSDSNVALSPDYCLEWPNSVPHIILPSYESFYSSSKRIDKDEENCLSCLERSYSISENKISKSLVSASICDSSFSAELRKDIKYKISDIKCKNKIGSELESFQCSDKVTNKRFKTSTCKVVNKIEEQSNIENSLFKNGIDISILFVLFRLSFHLEKKSNSELAGKSCFTVLFQYISSIQNANSNAEKILLELVKNRYCFEKLMLNGFVLEMDVLLKTVHPVSDCKHCLYIHSVRQTLIQTLSQQMESDYGVGTICHILCKSQKLSKFYAIYSTSKLVFSKTALRKILKQANGLSFIFDILNDTSINYQSILCLCQIYQNLSKSKRCCIFETCRINLTSKCAYKEEKLDVAFVVDNDAKIWASRDKLCCVDFFRALLKGHFKESEEKVIKICDISAETMTTIFHFLHGCYSLEYCPYIKRIPFEVLLELIGSCERFLLSDIKRFVADQLCHLLSTETLSKIYFTAKMFDFKDLYRKCIQHFFCLDLSKKDIVLKCFHEMNNFNFLNDVQSEIEFLLNN